MPSTVSPSIPLMRSFISRAALWGHGGDLARRSVAWLFYRQCGWSRRGFTGSGPGQQQKRPSSAVTAARCSSFKPSAKLKRRAAPAWRVAICRRLGHRWPQHRGLPLNQTDRQTSFPLNLILVLYHVGCPPPRAASCGMSASQAARGLVIWRNFTW